MVGILTWMTTCVMQSWWHILTFATRLEVLSSNFQMTLWTVIYFLFWFFRNSCLPLSQYCYSCLVKRRTENEREVKSRMIRVHRGPLRSVNVSVANLFERDFPLSVPIQNWNALTPITCLRNTHLIFHSMEMTYWLCLLSIVLTPSSAAYAPWLLSSFVFLSDLRR